MAGLSDKQRHNIDTARTSTTRQFSDIQGTMDKLDSLVDVVLARNPQLVERIQGEANRIGIIWTQAAPRNLDARSDAVYQGYRAPGYVRSLIDQLNDPKDPKIAQFWQEFSKSYDPAQHGDILKDAGKILGQDLFQKMKAAAPRATIDNAPLPTRNPLRDSAIDDTMDTHENVVPANFAETRVDPGNARQRDQLAVQALPVETLKKLGIGPTVESGMWDEPGVRKGAARISPLELTARDFNPDFLKDLQSQPGLIGVIAKALSQFFKHDNQAKFVDSQALERHLSQTLKDGASASHDRRAEADNPSYGIADIANRAGPTDLSQKTFQQAAALPPEQRPTPAPAPTVSAPIMSA